MSESVRKQKVSELNRILPMVRESIRREIENDQLKEEKKKKEKLVKEIQVSIANIEVVLGMPQEICTIKENLKNNLEELLSQQKEKLNATGRIIDDINDKIKQNNYNWEQETNLYTAILSVISVTNGFVLTEEIQEEFLKEYIYLLALDNFFNKRYTVNSIFKEADSFFEMILSRQNGPEIKELIDKKSISLNRKVFLELFE